MYITIVTGLDCFRTSTIHRINPVSKKGYAMHWLGGLVDDDVGSYYTSFTLIGVVIDVPKG